MPMHSLFYTATDTEKGIVARKENSNLTFYEFKTDLGPNTLKSIH